MKSGWIDPLWDLLFPAGCMACGSWLVDADQRVCTGCRASLREAPWPRCARCHHPLGTGRTGSTSCSECSTWPKSLTAARYAVVLDGSASDLVHGLKYEGWHEIAEVMVDHMIGLLATSDPDSVLVPIPTTAERARIRGYNQAELLSRAIAARTGRRHFIALERRSMARSQTVLGRDERRANVSGAFRLRPPSAALRGRPVVLIDDVITTGATAAEASETLAQSSCGAVSVAAFARALPLRRREAA